MFKHIFFQLDFIESYDSFYKEYLWIFIEFCKRFYEKNFKIRIL